VGERVEHMLHEQRPHLALQRCLVVGTDGGEVRVELRVSAHAVSRKGG